jgi:GMP synthase-like glutamine amidotransferase
MTVSIEEHVAIVVCDTPIEPLASIFGDFGDNCRDLLANGGLQLKSEKYQVCFEQDSDTNRSKLEMTLCRLKSEIASQNVKAIMFTGSRSDSFAATWWIKILDEFINLVVFPSKIPIIGVCFGHQILAKNLGSMVARNLLGWELGLVNIDINTKIMTKFPFNQFHSLFDNLNLIEFHQDIVYDVPELFENIGSTDICKIQGLFRYDDHVKILTFQGHPEFVSKLSLEHLLEMKDAGKISLQQYNHGIQTIESNKNCGPEIGNLMVSFLCGTNE